MNERVIPLGNFLEVTTPLKEPISDNEMGNFISAIGNNETKAVLLGLMQRDVIYSAHDLTGLMNRSQGEVKGWKMNVGGPVGYCKNSLEQIGLVAQEVTLKRHSLGYIKTEKGSHMGDSLAGLMLDFSLSHPSFALQDFFGSSQSKGVELTEGDLEYKNRTPEFRRKLFMYLVTAQLPVTAADIIKETGYTGSTDQHLGKLAEKGVLNYQSIKKGKTNIEYSFCDQAPEGNPDPIGGWNSATLLAYRYITENPERTWSPEELAKLYLESRGREVDPVLAHTSKMLEKILNHLVKMGYVVKTLELPEGAQSSVELTEKQREVLSDLSERLARFQNQESEVLEFGRRRLREILAEPNLVSVLLAKAREHSNYANSVPINESSQIILGVIAEAPGVTIEELRLALNSRGFRFNTSNLRGIVGKLFEGGSIMKQNRRGADYLFINASEPN